MSRTTVLAFARDWSPPADAALRGHLRGLGADLVVIGELGAWRIGADDDAIAIDARRYLDRMPDEGDAVYVLDGDRVRFTRETPDLASCLTGALAAACDALRTSIATPLLFDRREWAITSLCTGFALLLLGCKRKSTSTGEPDEPAGKIETNDIDIVLRVNGSDHAMRIDPRVSLLDALRERLGLTGTKKGCDAGQCGACTVHVDERAVTSCLVLAATVDGRPITTIEGVSKGDQLHPVQAAFVEHDGFQCGYCTPGQIMNAIALLAEGEAKTDGEVRERMSGNICRCGAYPNIIAAIQAARKAAT